MTTIAFRDGIMAADSQANMCGLPFSVEKLDIITWAGKPALFGGAGCKASCDLLAQWINEGCKETLPDWVLRDGQLGDFQCLMYLEHRGLAIWSAAPAPIRIKQEFYAVGSGAQAALAAMHMSATAHDAIEIAALVDDATGGEVRELSLDEMGR